MVRIHPSITEAIGNFQPPAGYLVQPPRRNETSVVFSYGVRIVEALQLPSDSVHPGAPAVWLCLATEPCREKLDVFYPLPTGKTPKATKHLREVHGVSSDKTSVEDDKKRRRDEDLDRLRMPKLYREDPTRVYILLETLRIDYNNLPFRFAEYEESISIRELVMKDCMQASVTAKVVGHAIVELYSPSKKGIVAVLKEYCIGSGALFCDSHRRLELKGKSYQLPQSSDLLC
ncbi:hypothetical protein DVH05_026558 [Phytophthora capsici]|nr:hypothetical protein DVH05_026558 [Phytophthora capsici]